MNPIQNYASFIIFVFNNLHKFIVEFTKRIFQEKQNQLRSKNFRLEISREFSLRILLNPTIFPCIVRKTPLSTLEAAANG
jgi:hypothetical protein